MLLQRSHIFCTTKQDICKYTCTSSGIPSTRFCFGIWSKQPWLSDIVGSKVTLVQRWPNIIFSISEPSHQFKLEFQPQSCLFVPSSQYHPCDSIKRTRRYTHRGESHDCPSLTPPLGSSPPLFPPSFRILYYVHRDLISRIWCLDLCNKYKKKAVKWEDSWSYMSRVSFGKHLKEDGSSI